MNKIKAIFIMTYKNKTRKLGFLLLISIAILLAYNTMPKLDSTQDFLGMTPEVFTRGDSIGWIPMNSAFGLALLFPLIGFLYFKTDLVAEHKSGIAQLMLVSKISNFQYLLGKYLAHLIILIQVMMVTIIATFISMKLIYPTDAISIYEFISPFLALSGGILLLALFPIIFDSITILRGLFGSIVYVFYYFHIFEIGMRVGKISTLKSDGPLNRLWALLFEPSSDLVLSITQLFDVSGLSLISHELKTIIFEQYNGQYELISLLFNARKIYDGLPLYLSGVRFDLFDLVIGIGIVIIIIIMLFLSSQFIGAKFKTPKLNLPDIQMPNIPILKSINSKAKLTNNNTDFTFNEKSLNFESIKRESNFIDLIIAELKVNYSTNPVWWYCLIALITILGYTLILGYVQYMLPLVIVVFVYYLSNSSCRESFYATEDIVHSSTNGRFKFVLAKWIAHSIIITIFSSGVLLRTIASGYFIGIFGYFAGLVFIVSLALFLGEYTKRPIFLQVYMLVTTYFSINKIITRDYIKISPNSQDIPASVEYLLMGVGFLMLVLCKDKIFNFFRDHLKKEV
ncbi:MAG: hypothetical protein ATN31_11395 [Candidatus Epulonipiscioides saccharophilum]|nr:MAG: hypothetical protein ATN31_11395 [Epulopiscium sp. AS2M-Bin001]